MSTSSTPPKSSSSASNIPNSSQDYHDSNTDLWAKLPDEIVSRILSHLTADTSVRESNALNYATFLELSMVNKNTYSVSFDRSINRTLTITSKGRKIQDLESDVEHKDWIRRVTIRENSYKLTDLAKNFKHISHLDLSRQVQVASPSELISFFKQCGDKLLYLDLSYCSKIDEQAINALCKYCKSLTHLSLRCTNEQSVLALLKNNSSSVSPSPNIPSSTITPDPSSSTSVSNSVQNTITTTASTPVDAINPLLENFSESDPSTLPTNSVVNTPTHSSGTLSASDTTNFNDSAESDDSLPFVSNELPT